MKKETENRDRQIHPKEREQTLPGSYMTWPKKLPESNFKWFMTLLDLILVGDQLGGQWLQALSWTQGDKKYICVLNYALTFLFFHSLASNIQKMFNEKIEIFSPVEFSRISILTGIVKIALKTLLECVRLRTFSR